ncbi:MAG: glycoside hydrolase [Verrucomicrobiae bacterium]|nr:glycoside hydrolase [Verrucomicrobiae bacterium]
MTSPRCIPPALLASVCGALLAAENVVVLNIEPSKEFPRNSEGAFVTLKSGRILFAYTQFYGGAADHSPARIVAIHSDDGGRTWSKEPRTIVENEGGANVMSVSLLRLKSGKIALFYLLKNNLLDCRPYVRFSGDEAQTWSEPKLVVPAPGYFVLNNDRVIQLSSGRLVVPVAFHRSRDTDPQSYKSFDARGIVLWYLSDDEGQTWTEAPTWWAAPVHSSAGLQEPGAVELADGKLFSWARTSLGTQYGFTSSDRGVRWSAPEPTPLKSPCSPASIKRLPGSSDLLAIYNDHSGEFPFVKNRRTPLVAAISSDGGKTWPIRKLLEGDPDGWYCYTAIHFVDNAVLLGYCAGDKKVGGLNRLRIRRLSLHWLRAQ